MQAIRPLVTLAAALTLALPPMGAAAQTMPRLPREAFDVIPPQERVAGERGGFRIWQSGCRVGRADQARRRIVDIAAQEWAAFGFQTIDRAEIRTRALPGGLIAESRNPPLPAPHADARILRSGMSEAARAAAPAIAGYWTATPDGADALARQNAIFSGPGGDGALWGAPWSAAFISWVMCEAGLGDMAQFQRDISHRIYIDQAIRARDGAAPDAAFVAHDAGEAEIAPGDLLCNARGRADYRSLADRRPDMDSYAPTHCDIVVRVDPRAGRILAIGGNVNDSVSLTILPATRAGSAHLRPLGEADLDGARTMFAHLKLRAPDIEPDALDNTPTISALADWAQD